MNRTLLLRAAIVVVSLVLSSLAQAQIDPRGLFFHEFTGAARGSEWSTWGSIPGSNRYNFSDLTATGSYDGTVSPSGSVTFDGGIGGGRFTDDDNHTLNFNFGGGFVFNSTLGRAPYTDAEFPVFRFDPVEGDRSLSGTWEATILDVDPETGETLGSTNEMVEVLVSGSTVRLTLEDGSFFQAAWKSDEQAGFRVVEGPAASQARYRTFPGSSLSEKLNLVGEIEVISANSMTATLFTQTRAPFGQQQQAARYLQLTRVPAPGCGVCTLLALGMTMRRAR